MPNDIATDHATVICGTNVIKMAIWSNSSYVSVNYTDISGNWVTSDMNIKSNIQLKPEDDYLSRFDKINVYTFTYKNSQSIR